MTLKVFDHTPFKQSLSILSITWNTVDILFVINFLNLVGCIN